MHAALIAMWFSLTFLAYLTLTTFPHNPNTDKFKQQWFYLSSDDEVRKWIIYQKISLIVNIYYFFFINRKIILTPYSSSISSSSRSQLESKLKRLVSFLHNSSGMLVSIFVENIYRSRRLVGLKICCCNIKSRVQYVAD